MKFINILLLSCVAFLAACVGGSAQNLLNQKGDFTSQTLCGDWQFRMDSTGAEWMAATVPGVVHTDLLANKKIRDPWLDTAEPELQWIEGKTWVYERRFTPESAVMESAVQELVFKGLDTYADVYLNDTLVLNADNMFREWRVDIAGRLKAGQENVLRVVFHPAYDVAEPLAKAWPVKLPADNDKGEPWKTSVFTRKAPYSFGWDWGPRYATVGVWKPVQIEAFSGARIVATQMIQKSQTPELATFDANITVMGASDGQAQIYVMDSVGNIYAQREVTLTRGVDSKFTLPFEIKNPRLWWPAGTGDPNLYALRTVVAHGSKKYDQKDENIGVRTIRWVQEPDSVGVSFYVEVNGIPVFAKGANYIPQDNFLPRVADSTYASLIKTTKESNMNMLRVWGGGIYEADIFYDLCDKNGIMVWQDFAFGCSLYPWNKEFLASVEQEAVDNIRRLRNHPSLVIWCGNNEITELWHHWGYQKAYGWTKAEQDSIYNGMRALFYELLPNVLKAEDSTRYYHPSSPLYGRGNPRSQKEGDVHYWGVFHDEEPFSVYKDKPGRFSNEYGFMSMACYDTYREYFSPEQLYLYSPAMVIHQKNAKGYRVMEEYMERDLPILKDSLREYIYLTQLLQAEGIKIAMEGQRSKRPWTMGSLYWQINDCWPVASWSSMDGRMRWKALQFYARRSFAPTILSFEKIDSTATLKLHGMNDRLEEKPFEGTVRLVTFDGKVLKTENIMGVIPANGNVEILHSTDRETLTHAGGEARPDEVFLVADATTADGEQLRSIYYFTELKNLKLPKADFDVKYEKQGKKVVATLTAKNLLKSALFEAQALQMNPTDGYFDLLPGETKEVVLEFVEDKPVEELGIFLTTLNKMAGRKGTTPIKENVK